MSFIGLTKQVFYDGNFGMDFELKPDQPERSVLVGIFKLFCWSR
jgi:hypothetical protein